MDTNFLGCARQSCRPPIYAASQHNGLLLHVSSGAGRIVVPGCSFYCASKFAMEAMAESYHYELAQQGIDSSIVEPGAYKTPVFGNIVRASDTARTDTYGAANKSPASSSDPHQFRCRPTRSRRRRPPHRRNPAGQRQLRYRVSPADLGVDAINDLPPNPVRILQAFGLTAETTFTQLQAASTDYTPL